MLTKHPGGSLNPKRYSLRRQKPVQARAHDRPDLLSEKALDVPGLREREVEPTYGEVDPLAPELHGPSADREMQGYIGMGALKTCKSRNQPAHGDRRLA